MTSTDRKRPERTWRVIGAMVAVITLLITARWLPLESWWDGLTQWIESLGFWAPLLFVAVYCLAALLMVPGTLITFGAPVLFGYGWGLIWVIIGSNAGANLAFLLGRYVARDWVRARIEGHARFRAVDQAVRQEGWKIVGLLRLSPLFPYNLLNYAFGLTSVRWWQYALATLLGMLPVNVMYVYIGYASVSVAQSRSLGTAQTVSTIIGLLATIAATWVVTRMATGALRGRGEFDS